MIADYHRRRLRLWARIRRRPEFQPQGRERVGLSFKQQANLRPLASGVAVGFKAVNSGSPESGRAPETHRDTGGHDEQ